MTTLILNSALAEADRILAVEAHADPDQDLAELMPPWLHQELVSTTLPYGIDSEGQAWPSGLQLLGAKLHYLPALGRKG